MKVLKEYGATIFFSALVGVMLFAVATYFFPIPQTYQTGLVSGDRLATTTNPATPPHSTIATSTEPVIEKRDYIQVLDSCGPHFEGECVTVYPAPATTTTSTHNLRSGIVLLVDEIITDGTETWYKIAFDEWLRYPDRVESDWYVKDSEHTRFFSHEGIETTYDDDYTLATTTKRIVVDLSEQTLYAYDGDELFMQQKISTGLTSTPTPRGTFTVFRKTPTRYMQGPIPGISTKFYDLPGVPWNLYFTSGGAVIHGTYWHNQFGKQWSNGCVNVPIEQAEKLYDWTPLNTKIIVQN